ncbi:hypothetical protein NBRC111894_2288 [Sporolactobacillus inulinus]|uniref:Uncharacterized protein n=1 Tax=Sporolactobacillus inulinus TaxID=2078 RepID=A0A4Y1ZCJ2_9BACL|nr:hypothetical protein NBRC111894_2288 [Sporolactobacillus inulinus]
MVRPRQASNRSDDSAPKRREPIAQGWSSEQPVNPSGCIRQPNVHRKQDNDRVHRRMHEHGYPNPAGFMIGITKKEANHKIDKQMRKVKVTGGED